MNGLDAFRLILAASAIAAAAAPTRAQDNSAQSAPPAEAVGPRELENFSLEGRVTRPAEEVAGPEAQPATPTPRQPSSAPPSERSVPRPVVESSADRAPATRPPAEEVLARPLSRPQPSGTEQARAEPPAAPPRPALVTDAPAEQGSSLLMWLAALLFAAGAAAVYWFVRGRGERMAHAGGYRSGYAGRGADSAPPEPRPAPLPRAAQPEPRPPVPATVGPRADAPVSSAPPGASPPSKPVGIVASSLRPWIDVELTPDRALVDDNGAAIAFNVTLVNSGSAPARDVSIEACLLNAGARQDSELSDFYQKPKSSSDSIPVIAPMARVPLRTAVKIPRDMIHEYEVEGRKLFMPMVAVSTRYRWSSGEGQTGASFLVGKGKEEQERLAPLRIDQGARSWNGLGARRYEKGLRR